MTHDNIEFINNIIAYAILVAILLLKRPQLLHIALQVAAPQQLAAKVIKVPTVGTANNGRDTKAPMIGPFIRPRQRFL